MRIETHVYRLFIQISTAMFSKSMVIVTIAYENSKREHVHGPNTVKAARKKPFNKFILRDR